MAWLRGVGPECECEAGSSRSYASVSTMRPPTPSTSSTAPMRVRATCGASAATSAGRSRLAMHFFRFGRFAQETAALVRPQAGVKATLRQQFAVRALLHDAALVHDHQAVERGNGGQPVRDRDHRLALHQLLQARLDGGLDLGVERT